VRGGLTACLILLVAGCAAPGTGRDNPATGTDHTSAPRTVRIGVDASHEPSGGFIIFSTEGIGWLEHALMFHAGLAVYNEAGELQPRLARKVPTIEDGDWQLLPDGAMELTWNLRPDARWHDGTQLTAEDFALGMQIVQDPELPARRARGVNLIASTTAPDAETVVVRWKQPYMLANAATVELMPAVAHHLLGDAYQQGDKQNLVNHPYWAREFVGLGPYRLGAWELGSQVEAIAFDQYFLGRPKIDRLILRYFGTPNTLVANLLSGDIDMAPTGSSLDISHLITVREAWEPAQVGTATTIPRGVRDVYLQHREPIAPILRDVRLRRALVHMTDRSAFVDILQSGLTTAAQANITREDPAYRLMEQRSFSTYPYDLTAAARLLADAGWTRTAEGFQDSAGQRLAIDVAGTNRGDAGKEIGALAGQWAEAGIQTTETTLNTTATNYDELRANVKGVFLFNWTIRPEAAEGLISGQVASEANRWRGTNFSGYSNPAFDRLYDQYSTTLEAGKRQELLADLMRMGADEVATIPLYYLIEPMIFRKGIRGLGIVPPLQLANAWNIHTWEMD
jgi:peptide/nickel transport system substrate-binding protein